VQKIAYRLGRLYGQLPKPGRLAVLAVLVASAAWPFLPGGMEDLDTPPAQVTQTSLQPVVPPVAEPELSSKPLTITPILGAQWTYARNSDPMGSGTYYVAYVTSLNTIELGYPYGGPQRATLTLLMAPDGSGDVIFEIERGQLLCESYEECLVSVRFDDGQREYFSALGPSDGSTTRIYISNYRKFYGKLNRAKRVRLAAGIYQGGAPAFEFDISDFDPKKYKP
jgi:hypothetical protein